MNAALRNPAPRRRAPWLSYAAVLTVAVAAAARAAPQDGAPVTPAVAQPAAAAPKKPAQSTAQIDAGEPRANTSPGAPAARAAPRSATAGPGTASAAAKAPTAADRVELGTATVTGDREQPKVMYIVPWKSADLGDLSGKPMNSLLDEALAPVDREVFKREVAYYDAVKADRAPSANSAPVKQVEK